MTIKELYELIKPYGDSERPIRMKIGTDNNGCSKFIDFNGKLWFESPFDAENDFCYLASDNIEQKRAKFMLISLD